MPAAKPPKTVTEVPATNQPAASIEGQQQDVQPRVWLPGATPAANVIEAICAVKAALPGIGKVDTSPQLEYAYRGIETLTAHLQGLTAQHGLVIMPAAVVTKEVVEYQVKSGATWTETRITFRWAVYGPGGADDVIYGESVGHGRDRDDRGGSKAMTQAYKEFLIKLFCIGDKSTDPDHATPGEEGERFDTNGRIIGKGEPPPEPQANYDWHALGWTDAAKPNPEQIAAAQQAHDAEMTQIGEALKTLNENTQKELRQARKATLGELPLSKAAVTTWAGMVDAALTEMEDAAKRVSDAFEGTTEEEPF